MNIKKSPKLIVVALVLVTTFAFTASALAWSQCPTYITVQRGDTLSGIAALCGTTMDAIRAVNPGLGWWLYEGQILYIPSSYNPPPPTSGIYVVQSGDTLRKIASRMGTSVNSILAVNPQIANPNLIYVGQVINIPAGGNVPLPPPLPTPTHAVDGYSKLKIAYKYGLYIRSAPGGTILASAMNKDTLYYRPNSVYIDKKWKVWVEVKLYPPTKGYTTGWILVRDQFGTYFTDPQIDP